MHRGSKSTRWKGKEEEGKPLLLKQTLRSRFTLLRTYESHLTPGRALPYMGYIGMCRCEGYGFQAVYSRIGYINQSVWV